jgi:hypothetical protein
MALFGVYLQSYMVAGIKKLVGRTRFPGESGSWACIEEAMAFMGA